MVSTLPYRMRAPSLNASPAQTHRNLRRFRSPARQRATEYGVHPHMFGDAQPEVLPLTLYPDVVEATLDDLVGNAESLLLEYLVQSGEMPPAQKLHPMHSRAAASTSIGPRFSTITTSMRRLRRRASRSRWMAKNEPAGPPPTTATRSSCWSWRLSFEKRRGAWLSQFANNVGAVPAAHGRPLRGNYSILVRRIIAGILRLGCPGSS